ncbi:hypothetical protein LDENG_00244500, partial [Lucifuga dentata]
VHFAALIHRDKSALVLVRPSDLKSASLAFTRFHTSAARASGSLVMMVLEMLMKRLGFQQFYAHGGDWGWLITTNMAQMRPKVVKGLHLNFAPPSKPDLPMVLSIMLGQRFPKLFGFTEMDIQHLYPCMDKLVVESIKESGYMHIQATKPDTVGRGLNDSPVGLAAYILEKFSTWTSRDFRCLDDGGLTRFYKENFGKGLSQTHAK